jgi:hypothetical protein
VTTRAAIVDAVLAAYARWGLGAPVSGEWASIRADARTDLHRALANGDRDLLARVLCEPAGRHEWWGLYSELTGPARISDMAVSWSITCKLAAPLRPMGGEEDLPDTPRHDAEAAQLATRGHTRILEIGGGYGGMALSLWRRVPALRYVDMDLADTLYLAYAFLAPRLPVGSVVLGYDPDATVSLVSSHDIPAMGEFGVVCNFRGWGEMGRTEVARYFALIPSWTPQWVIYENAANRVGLTELATGNVFPEVQIRDYPRLVGYRRRATAPSMWAAGGGRFQREEWEKDS